MKKRVTAYGALVVMTCDGRCDKAWGINSRPREQLSDDPDDYVFKRDSELGTAPADPGTYEGGHGKPSAVPLSEADSERMNKWCFRECERCVWGSDETMLMPPDLENPRPNIPVEMSRD